MHAIFESIPLPGNGLLATLLRRRHGSHRSAIAMRLTWHAPMEAYRHSKHHKRCDCRFCLIATRPRLSRRSDVLPLLSRCQRSVSSMMSKPRVVFICRSLNGHGFFDVSDSGQTTLAFPVGASLFDSYRMASQEATHLATSAFLRCGPGAETTCIYCINLPSPHHYVSSLLHPTTHSASHHPASICAVRNPFPISLKEVQASATDRL